MEGITNQSSRKNGLNLVRLDQSNVQTVKIRDENSKNDEKRPRIIDSPKIKVTIFNNKYIALLDTGATISMCSESL